MPTATSSVGAVFLVMAASMTGFVTWNYNTERHAEQAIAEIVPEGDALEHEELGCEGLAEKSIAEALEPLEWRLVTDARSHHFLNTELLPDIPLAACAAVVLLACIEVFAAAWMLRVLRRFCCRRGHNGWKVMEVEDAVAENERGNGPLPMLLSPAYEAKPLLVSSRTNGLTGEAGEDTEKVVDDSVGTNVIEICPSPVLLSPSRTTADNREKAVFIRSQTMDLAGEDRCVHFCAPPCDTLTSDVLCDTLMHDVPCDTFAQSAVKSSLTVDLTGESRGVPFCAPPCDTLTSDVLCDTLMSDMPCDTFAQSALKSSLTVDLTGEGRGVPLHDIPCDTVQSDFPRDTLLSDFSRGAFTGTLGSSCGQYLTKSLDLTGPGVMSLNELNDHEDWQGPTPRGSVSSASSIEIELFGGSSDATITMDLTSGRSGRGLVAGSRS